MKCQYDAALYSYGTFILISTDSASISIVAKTIIVSEPNLISIAGKYTFFVESTQPRCLIVENMSENYWILEMERMLAGFEQQASSSLDNILRHFETINRSFDDDFRKVFLQVSHDR